HGFAIAFRARHAEIVLEALRCGAAFLVADDQNGTSQKLTEPAENGGVLTIFPIAGEFDELGDERTDIVAKAWAVGVAGDLGFLPGIEFGIDGCKLVFGFGFQTAQLLALADGVGA